MLDTADQALDRLLSPKSGITSATGFIQSKFPTVRESTKEAENDIELLRSVLTLNVAEQNILKGVLSDPDMELLMKAGSGALDLNRSDETVLNELFKIKEKVAMAKRGLGIQPQQTTETKSKARLRYNPATGELE